VEITLEQRELAGQFLESSEGDFANLGILERYRLTLMPPVADPVESDDVPHQVVSGDLLPPAFAQHRRLARSGADRVKRGETVSALKYRLPFCESLTRDNQAIKLSHRVRAQPGRQAQLAHAASGAVCPEIADGNDVGSRNWRIEGRICHRMLGTPRFGRRIANLSDDLAANQSLVPIEGVSQRHGSPILVLANVQRASADRASVRQRTDCRTHRNRPAAMSGNISVESVVRLGPRYLQREQRTQTRAIECVNKVPMNCGRVFGAQRLGR
jgi:hypothetical protein